MAVRARGNVDFDLGMGTREVGEDGGEEGAVVRLVD